MMEEHLSHQQLDTDLKQPPAKIILPAPPGRRPAPPPPNRKTTPTPTPTTKARCPPPPSSHNKLHPTTQPTSLARSPPPPLTIVNKYLIRKDSLETPTEIDARRKSNGFDDDKTPVTALSFPFPPQTTNAKTPLTTNVKTEQNGGKATTTTSTANLSPAPISRSIPAPIKLPNMASGGARSPQRRRPTTGLKRNNRPPALAPISMSTSESDVLKLQQNITISKDLGRVGLGELSIGTKVINIKDCTFTKLGLLGRGSFGVVKKWQLRHNIDGEKKIMAIKEIPDNDIVNRQRLIGEIDIVRKSKDCEYIIDYFGVALDQGHVMIYMEVMKASLDQVYHKIKDKKTENVFPEDVLIYISIAMLKGLIFLKEHANSMHRDVKPANVLLGSQGEIKLTDFGLAKVMDSKSLLSSNVGSERYMAPERLQGGSREYGTESDIWSFGISMVELACLKHPLHGKTTFDVLQTLSNAFETGNEFVVTLPERYSDDFNSFLRLCLRKRGLRPLLRKSAPDDVTEISLQKRPFYVKHAQDEFLDAKHWLIQQAVPFVDSAQDAISPSNTDVENAIEKLSRSK
eukprot:m.51458 g.51458  ORF g.51458 m.51458 type:complete len:572 (-) comp21447_c0_seq1:139-1854(-)